MSMQKIENCTSCEFYQEVHKEEDKIFARVGSFKN